jgi:hypothetical protein
MVFYMIQREVAVSQLESMQCNMVVSTEATFDLLKQNVAMDAVYMLRAENTMLLYYSSS